jgi:hypothetical protein
MDTLVAVLRCSALKATSYIVKSINNCSSKYMLK